MHTLTTKTVHSFIEVKSFIEELGKPIDGCVRVFRGQTQEFLNENNDPSLLPALFRRSGQQTYDPSWLTSMTMLVSNQLIPGLQPDFVAANVWGPALVQHYGSGSVFLDVSSNLEVAFWFSRHKHHEHWIVLKEGNDPKDLQDQYFNIAWFTEIDESQEHNTSPVIYIFDVKPWNGKAFPHHGELVDLLALEPSRQLAVKASRLRCQSASLIYSDPMSPEGRDLNIMLSGRMILSRDFDVTGADLARQPVSEIFPPPPKDDLYKTLIELPSYMRFDPIRLEQPITTTLYLGKKFPLYESINVRDLGGTGDYTSPKRLRFRIQPGPDLDVVLQLYKYLSLGRHMTPPLLYTSLLETDLAVDLAERHFNLKDALVLLLETPIWTVTPNVDEPRMLNTWIQSSLPLGIADEIAGRSTDNVYVEICPLDFIQPGQIEGKDFLRGMWVVRAGSEYEVTIFRRGNIGTYSITVQYRYDADAGIFERQSLASLEDGAETIANSTLKALFVTLTVLRDLSPGFKPPPAYSMTFNETNYFPAMLLEPQLGKPYLLPSTPYVIPKALDGTPYLRFSGVPTTTPMLPDNSAKALSTLERFFPHIRAPHYIAAAGAELVELNVAYGRFDHAREILEHSLKAAQSTGFKLFIARLEQLKGKISIICNE